MTGRIPYAPERVRRLDPIRIRETNEGSLFEQLVSQLMEGLIHGTTWSKVTWKGLPVTLWKGNYDFTMDLATWVERTYDYLDNQSSVFIDVEPTVRDLQVNDEYVAQKILYLVALTELPDGIKAAISRLREEPAHAKLKPLSREPIPYLIFVSNRAEALPDIATIRPHLKGKGAVLKGSDPRIEIRKSGDNSFVVTTPAGKEVYVGLVAREKLLELTYLAQALDQAKRQDEVDERFLHDLTSLAAKPLLLSPMPRKVEILGAAPPTPIQIDGHPVTFYRFSVNPFDFLRMSTVLRLVSDYAYLQRLPDGGHLAGMAHDMALGGRFPTPVLCIPPIDNVVKPESGGVFHAGGAVVSPYQWHIIDGQHRAFSYYLIKPGAPNIQDLDVNCYVLARPEDQPAIASALFLDVNFRAIKPPIDLALAHYAYATQWPAGDWVPRKRGRMHTGDSQLYSARVLASRLLLEMSQQDTVFHNFFKYRGAKDKGKASIQSISTYMSSDFEFHDPSDRANPFAVRYGTVKGATGDWTTPNPPPESLKAVWDRLVNSFDEFLTLAAESNGRTPLQGVDRLRELVSKNNNVFVGLWKTFFWYSFKRIPDSPTVPIITPRLAKKVIPWLDRLDSRGFLAGPKNKYRSGSGAVEMANRMIKLVGGP